MSEEEQRAVENFVAHQMFETCGQILDGINNYPLSMTTDSFWDVLFSKPHRHVLPASLTTDMRGNASHAFLMSSYGFLRRSAKRALKASRHL